jgi:curved DNA-binding protein CbpA
MVSIAQMICQDSTQILMASPESNDRYYRRLAVGPDASQAEIVAAYRRLAQGAHPDMHPEDPEAPRRFREITEAYEVLSDSARRPIHSRDRGHDGVRPIRVVQRTAGAGGSDRVDPPDPPVVLGGARLFEDRPLQAGPVRIEGGNQMPAPVRGDVWDGDSGGFLRLFSDLLDALRRF